MHDRSGSFPGSQDHHYGTQVLLLEDSFRGRFRGWVGLKEKGENSRRAEWAPFPLYVNSQGEGAVKKFGRSGRGSVQINVARKFFRILLFNPDDAHRIGAYPRLGYGGKDIFHLPLGVRSFQINLPNIAGPYLRRGERLDDRWNSFDFCRCWRCCWLKISPSRSQKKQNNHTEYFSVHFQPSGSIFFANKS